LKRPANSATSQLDHCSLPRSIAVVSYVKEYTVFAPSLHTSEDSRWDYRVIIVRASEDAPPGQFEGEVAKQLFPDQEAFEREENRRWELTTNHWDLPIHVVKVDAAE
jgi:hypothetical protein